MNILSMCGLFVLFVLRKDNYYVVHCYVHVLYVYMYSPSVHMCKLKMVRFLFICWSHCRPHIQWGLYTHSHSSGARLWSGQFKALLLNLFQQLPVLDARVWRTSKRHDLPNQHTIAPVMSVCVWGGGFMWSGCSRRSLLQSFASEKLCDSSQKNWHFGI